MALTLIIANEAISQAIEFKQQVIDLKSPSQETLVGVIKKSDIYNYLVISMQTAADSSQEVSMFLSNQTTITLDGKEAEAADLRPGQAVMVKCTVEKKAEILNNIPIGEVVERTATVVSAVSSELQAASLVTAESWSGSVPLKALAPFGNIKNMMSLVKAPNVPDDVLTGKTEFNERGVGMVFLPAKYVSIVIKFAIFIQSKTTIKASEFTILDAQKKTYHGTLWDDGLHAWVCSEAEYEPGQ